MHFPLIRMIPAFISLVFIVNRIGRFIRKDINQSIFKLITTILVWSGILIISIYPDIAYVISRKLGSGDNLNSFIFIGFIILFILVFKLLSLIEIIEKSITDIIRQQAIENFKQQKKLK